VKTGKVTTDYTAAGSCKGKGKRGFVQREHTSKALRYGTRSQRISQFYLHSPRQSANGMNHTCIFFPSQSWSLFTDPGGMEGWVGLGGWLHTEINARHRELNPDTVTHLSANRARRRLTLLIEPNTLPLRQTATVPPLCTVHDTRCAVNLVELSASVRRRAVGRRWLCLCVLDTCWLLPSTNILSLTHSVQCYYASARLKDLGPPVIGSSASIAAFSCG